MPQRRVTAQQRAIQHAFETAERPLSVSEIKLLAQDRAPSLSSSTVYRVLHSLLEDGDIASVAVLGQPDRYELATAAATHHHHFRCEVCDRVFDIHACPGGFEQMLPEGFHLDRHEISLWGRCTDCA